MTDKEFDKFWEEGKRMEEKRYAEYDALPEEEKERREKEFEECGYGRFLESPLGNEDDD